MVSSDPRYSNRSVIEVRSSYSLLGEAGAAESESLQAIESAKSALTRFIVFPVLGRGTQILLSEPYRRTCRGQSTHSQPPSRRSSLTGRSAPQSGQTARTFTSTS